VTPFGRKGKQLERRADALRNLPRGVIGAYFAAIDRIDENAFRAARKQAFQD
jgi:hypothetical protein